MCKDSRHVVSSIVRKLNGKIREFIKDSGRSWDICEYLLLQRYKIILGVHFSPNSWC
jgi:hypothetical protein